MANEEPRIDQEAIGGAATLTLSGDWVASHTAQLEVLSQETAQAASKVTIDARKVQRLDSFGAWAIESLRRKLDVQADVVGLNRENLALLAQMQRSSVLLADSSSEKPIPGFAALGRGVESLGRSVEDAIAEFFAVLSLLGRLVLSLVAGVRRPQSLRIKSIIHHMDRVGVRAVPIIALITFLIGCIIAQQGLFYFRKFGATDYVVNLVVILVLREIGVLLVAIMVAGRSGSSYAAELGSMKMREEVDALRTMGLDPVDLLVLPRVLALVLAVPILTLVGIFSALYGAGLVVWASGDMSPAVYLARLHDAATYSDFEVGMIKAPIMAAVIGVVAALEGMKVQGSAESLGLGATASVVKAIFFVIVLDGAFAVLFTSLGM